MLAQLRPGAALVAAAAPAREAADVAGGEDVNGELSSERLYGLPWVRRPAVPGAATAGPPLQRANCPYFLNSTLRLVYFQPSEEGSSCELGYGLLRPIFTTSPGLMKMFLTLGLSWMCAITCPLSVTRRSVVLFPAS